MFVITWSSLKLRKVSSVSVDLLLNSKFGKRSALSRYCRCMEDNMFDFMGKSKNPFVKWLHDDIGLRTAHFVILSVIILVVGFFVVCKPSGEILVAKDRSVVTVSYEQNGQFFTDTFYLRWNGERFHILDQNDEGTYNVIVGDIIYTNGAWTLTAFRMTVQFNGTVLGREIGDTLRGTASGVNNFTLR
jgi:hypothetical protein